MVTPGTTDVIYMGRPKWSVAHHLSVAGVPSPSKAAAFDRLSKRHHWYVIAASIVIGFVLAAIYFAFVKVQQVATTVREAAQPWAASAVEAKEKAPAVGSQDIQSRTPVTEEQNTSTTSITINGEQIPVPENGNIHKTYINGASRSTVDIQVRQSSGP
jgi:hypothetical protein